MAVIAYCKKCGKPIDEMELHWTKYGEAVCVNCIDFIVTEELHRAVDVSRDKKDVVMRNA